MIKSSSRQKSTKKKQHIQIGFFQSHHKYKRFHFAQGSLFSFPPPLSLSHTHIHPFNFSVFFILPLPFPLSYTHMRYAHTHTHTHTSILLMFNITILIRICAVNSSNIHILPSLSQVHGKEGEEIATVSKELVYSLCSCIKIMIYYLILV